MRQHVKFCKFCLNIPADSTLRLTYWDTRPSAFFLGYRMRAGGLKVSVTSHDYVVQSFPPEILHFPGLEVHLRLPTC